MHHSGKTGGISCDMTDGYAVTDEHLIHRWAHQVERFDAAQFNTGGCEEEPPSSRVPVKRFWFFRLSRSMVHAHSDSVSISQVEGAFFNSQLYSTVSEYVAMGGHCKCFNTLSNGIPIGAGTTMSVVRERCGYRNAR